MSDDKEEATKSPTLMLYRNGITVSGPNVSASTARALLREAASEGERKINEPNNVVNPTISMNELSATKITIDSVNIIIEICRPQQDLYIRISGKEWKK